MRKIGVVTVGRSDYGIYRSVLRRIQGDPDLRLHLLAGGMHLLKKYGLTIKEIGEDGFEIYLPQELAIPLWEKVLSEGKAFSLLPCGLGARDTLRLEQGYLLYGNDIDETTTPLEAGLKWQKFPCQPIGFWEILKGSTSLKKASCSSYYVVVVVDPANLIIEADENNNVPSIDGTFCLCAVQYH